MFIGSRPLRPSRIEGRMRALARIYPGESGSAVIRFTFRHATRGRGASGTGLTECPLFRSRRGSAHDLRRVR
jgi:hypothetical protein